MGYRATGLQGYRATSIQGYRDTGSKYHTGKQA